MAVLSFPTPTIFRNLDTPTANTDATTKLYVDQRIANSGGGTSTQYLQVANANITFNTKATWTALASTNTALRILISDRIQVANVAAKYTTKAYAASNAYVKMILANTNAYIASVAASGGGGGEFSSEAFDYGFITTSADVDQNRDYGTL